MPVDYLDSLRKFSAGGGTDINAFLKQHTLPDQTTPGPSVPKPVSDITPPPTPPTNVVRQSMGPAAPPDPGALATLPRNPIRSQARILGESRPPTPITVTPAAPQPARTAFTPPVPVLGTAPRQPSATPAAPAEDPFRFRLPSEKASNRDFLTGAKIAENDAPPGAAPYSSGPLANPKPTPGPRQRNQRAVDPVVPRIFSGVA